ncbi:hypothetical protein JCM16303_007159 [Sporobolomyces ruberrimus]
MSFVILPFELQEAVILDLYSGDLVALCLTSKALLRLARPLLYRAIYFDLSFGALALMAKDDTEEKGDEGGQIVKEDTEKAKRELLSNRPRRDAALYATLEAHPEWTAYVKSVNLKMCSPLVAGQCRAAQLFASFSALRILEVSDEQEPAPGTETCTFLVQNCPRKVIWLDLTETTLDATGIGRLLEELPLLEHLVVGGKSQFHLSARHSTPLTLPHLSYLELYGHQRSTQFMDGIIQAAPSLSTMEVEFASIPALDPTQLDRLCHLTIYESMWTSLDPDDPSHSPEKMAEQILSVVRACTSLVSLELTSVDDYDDDDLSVLEESPFYHVLQQLPRSLRSLTIYMSSFSPSYSFDFLASRTCSLQHLTLSHFAQSFDTTTGQDRFNVTAEEQVKAICEEREIPLTWTN